MTSENIYQAPEAELVVTSSDEEKLQFFTTTIRKLIILSICTFNIYSLYWFYKHWQAQKLGAGVNCKPVLRAIFQVFFVYSLFSKIKIETASKGIKAAWGAGLFATVYILLQITSVVTGQIFSDPSFIIVSLFISFGISLLGVIPLIVAQKTANQLNGDPEGKQNEQFSGLNWLCIVLGVCYFSLIIFSSVAVV